jgi:hypothetical protein
VLTAVAAGMIGCPTSKGGGVRALAAGAWCHAELNYVQGTGEPAPVEVEIIDGRGAELPGWEVCGFELVRHRPAVAHWEDEHEVAALHHPEIEALACSMTGADHALVSSHITRSPDEAARHQDLAPITFVHSDFAESYLGVVRDSYRLPTEGARAALDRNGLGADDLRAARRIVILQFWRNLGPAKMDLPLAFCDARSVGPDEAHPFPVADYAGRGIDFEALAVVAPGVPGRHRWFAFPELQRDEVVAFRTYDTDLVVAGATFFTPHSAFRDPDVPLGRPARTSIELRATCLFA